MDVRCNRCGTEYEFDDALISERGTTVKCTNCGLQFKIFPTAVGGGPERWVVRTVAGRELVFTSLRELQRGIAERKVGPEDMLSRGQKPPRPLSAIAELEPFFQNSLGKLQGERQPRTLHGVAPPANSIPTSNVASTMAAPFVGPFDVPEPPGVPAPVSAPKLRAEAPLMDSLSVTMPAVSPEPPLQVPAALAGVTVSQLPVSPPSSPQLPPARETMTTMPAVDPEPPPLSRTLELDPSRTAAEAPVPLSSTVSLEDYDRVERRKEPRAAHTSSPRIPLETVPRSSPNSSPRPSPNSSPRAALDITPRPPNSGQRASFHSYDELSPADIREPGTRRARSRWIVGVVLLGMMGLVGVTVGKRYLAARAIPSATPVATSDARVKDFLERGNRLAEEGDFEAAQEELVKASALAEKDAAVMAALAHLETLRADVFWLRLRLLDPASTELISATHRELGRRVGRARQAVDRAFAAAPEDPIVIRARVDAMRLSGESDKAREWIAPVSGNASQPENAYVLAALDLSDAAPVWASVIDRLHTASAGEREPGRARAALIYALARADRLSEARAELSKLEAQPRPHVLLEELRAFLSRFADTKDAGAGVPGGVKTLDVASLPKLDTSVPAEDKPAAPGDFRTALSQAAGAARSGDLDRADTLYRSALASQPGNVEALSGLGDVARRRGDAAGAAKLYDQVLQQNPSYLPAMIASADQKWASGDRGGALTLYRRIVEQVGAGSDYGARAQSRLSEASQAGVTEKVAAPAAPSTAATLTPEPAPASDTPPPIDTSDLPGAH